MNRETGTTQTIVSLQRVAARIEGRLVLDDVSLELRAGEHLGIVGENGSGKSTLLRLIGGTHWPAPGSGKRLYRFDDTSHRDAVEARRRITLVGPELQDSYLRLGWNFSASAVVVTGLHRTEIPRRKVSATDLAKARELLRVLEAEHLAERAFLELSRGEQRRVLIARALAFDPDVLLLDEPGSGLDVAAREELDRAISAAATQATIVATAHTVDALPAVVSHVVEVRDHCVKPFTNESDTRPGTSTRTTAPPAATQSTEALPALVELHNADVWVAERCVLKNITWRLEQGDNWLVTGRNGAGKSTFLRLLHGQIRPARGGTIEWPALGNPRNIWELRRSIGWVSPELQADYRLPTTVAQCVASGVHSSIGVTGALSDTQHARCDSLIRGFGLDELRDRLLSRLSYGQARRALLARTLASAPRLLLLDEPWEGLDPTVVDLVVEQLHETMRSGTQIVCASHIGDAGLGANRAMEIANGTLNEYALS